MQRSIFSIAYAFIERLRNENRVCAVKKACPIRSSGPTTLQGYEKQTIPDVCRGDIYALMTHVGSNTYSCKLPHMNVITIISFLLCR